jgi:RNA-directed DNA polymerase
MNIGDMQRKLSQKAQGTPEHKFQDLYGLLLSDGWLLLAHDYVAQNAGSVTAGCDGVDMAYFDEDLWGNLQKIAKDLRSGDFEPYPVRRVYIPKKDGKLRPLGIPSIRDRIVQEALRMILEPIFEADFVQHSYGFRPNRRTMDAIKCILWASREPRKYFWVIEGDISSYFDTIHHRKLIKILRRRIADEKILTLLWKFLRAGVMERTVLQATDKGTPQGGIISPLLANVYLHELDKYMERYTAIPTRDKYQRRQMGLPNVVHVRYADDFVVMCNGTKAQTGWIKEEIANFLRDQLDLTLSPEKTVITHLNRGFEFLGFRIKRGRGGQGTVTKSLIPRKAMRKHLDKLRTATAPSTCNDSIVTKIQALNRIIGGWCRYYLHTGNITRTFAILRDKTFWLMGHWFGRKLKRKIWKVRQAYWRNDGFATGKHRLQFHTEYKAVPYKGQFHKPNPYLTQAVITRENLPQDQAWAGYEARPGQADLKLLALKRDGSVCRDCKVPVTESTSHLHHLREVRFFKNPVDANTLPNVVVLCIPCHKVRTEIRRQQLESRVR